MSDWVAVCTRQQLIPERGVAVLVRHQQVALFRVTGSDGSDFIHAVGHRDPFCDANVIARGIVGSVGNRDTVASPMYKHVFDLASGGVPDRPLGAAPGLPDLDRRGRGLRAPRPAACRRARGGPSRTGGCVSELAPVLTGTRILVTAQRRSDELAGALERRGATVTVAPTLGVVPNIDEQGLLRRTTEILEHGIDTLVVTTAIGFRGWLDTAEAAGIATDLITALETVRLVARGPKARGALQAAGLKADWVAESETSAEIVEFLLTEGVVDQRIAIQHHGAGDRSMEVQPASAGATVFPLEVYRWGPPADPAAVAESALQVAAASYDAVLFTSAPAAQSWLEALGRAGVTEIVRDQVTAGRLLLAAVGPMTADPLVNAGMASVFPDRSRMGALVRLVIMTLGDAAHTVVTPAGVLRVRASAATLDHQALPLSPNGLTVLRRLAETPGHVVSRDVLLRVLPGASDDPHTAEVAIARLREALGSREMVRTVIKRGYVLQVVA